MPKAKFVEQQSMLDSWRRVKISEICFGRGKILVRCPRQINESVCGRRFENLLPL